MIPLITGIKNSQIHKIKEWNCEGLGGEGNEDLVQFSSVAQSCPTLCTP